MESGKIEGRSQLEVRQLRKIYPNGYEALSNISFEIRGGEFVCIIGRSGAGKSTCYVVSRVGRAASAVIDCPIPFLSAFLQTRRTSFPQLPPKLLDYSSPTAIATIRK